MLLDLIMMIFTLMGIVFIIPVKMFTADMDPWGMFPWEIIGVIFFVCELAIIRWRGSTSTFWKVIDFPEPGKKIGLTALGSRLVAEYVLPSPIQTMIRTGDDSRYYRDNPDGTYSIGGHDGRLIDYEVSYCIAKEQAHLVHDLDEKGFHSLEDVKEWIKNYMVQMRNKSGQFVFSHEDGSPLLADELEIERNKIHKQVFDKIADKFFVKVHGRAYTLKHYHRFQEKQAPPVVIGTIVHYIKALAYMKAVRIKKNVGGGSSKMLGYVLLGIIGIVIVVIMLIFTGVIDLGVM